MHPNKEQDLSIFNNCHTLCSTFCPLRSASYPPHRAFYSPCPACHLPYPRFVFCRSIFCPLHSTWRLPYPQGILLRELLPNLRNFLKFIDSARFFHKMRIVFIFGSHIFKEKTGVVFTSVQNKTKGINP